jgi:hypothetical protein
MVNATHEISRKHVEAVVVQGTAGLRLMFLMSHGLRSWNPRRSVPRSKGARTLELRNRGAEIRAQRRSALKTVSLRKASIGSERPKREILISGLRFVHRKIVGLRDEAIQLRLVDH